MICKIEGEVFGWLACRGASFAPSGLSAMNYSAFLFLLFSFCFQAVHALVMELVSMLDLDLLGRVTPSMLQFTL